MTEQGQQQAAKDRKQHQSGTIEDLQPSEEASAGVKGGPTATEHTACKGTHY